MSRYFYKSGNIIYYIEETGNELKEQTIKEKCKVYGINYYEAQKEYIKILNGLLLYREDFNKWAEETENEINYKKYFNHESAVIMVFRRFATRELNKLKTEDIIYKEFVFLENCYNGSLQTFDDKYKDVELESFGNDFSGYYPTLLAESDFKFPIQQGKRKKIKKLKFDNLEYGIYKVKITSDNKDFRKIFGYSKQNLYTHYCLLFAYKNKDRFNINIELLSDDKYNCIVWTEDKLVSSKLIFGKWFSFLKELKIKYPKNKLVKRLSSSLWGSITKFKREFFEDDDFFELDVSRVKDSKQTEYKLIKEKTYKDDTKELGIRTVYEVVKSINPYDNNLARLKPFFTSYTRNYMSNLILDENLLDCLIRTHTDNITLTRPHNFTHLKYYPLPEDKTTGLITWSNVNRYEKSTI